MEGTVTTLFCSLMFRWLWQQL